MPRKSIQQSQPKDFEPRRKNPISLGNDSNIDNDFKGLNINDVPAGIERYKQTHANFFPEEKVYNINCEHERNEDVYIDAQGRIAPCCYQGFDLPDVPFIKLEGVSKLKETWATKKCNPVCAMSCGN